MLDLDQFIVTTDGPDDDSVLAIPRAVAEIVFHEAFALSAHPRLTYADFVAKQRSLEASWDTPDGDDLLAVMMAETRLIKKTALKDLIARQRH